MQIRNQNLTKQFILENISQEDIFSKYLDLSDISTYLNNNNKFFNNSLRGDNNPTCTFKVFPNGLIWFKDWADTRGYDCFGLVQKIYNNCTFYEALELIALHFNLLDKTTSNELKYVLDPIRQIKVLQENTISKIEIKSIPFSQKDINYWNQYYLGLEDLTLDIKAIKCYWFNEAKHNCSLTEPNYAYDWDNGDFKLYFPFKDRKKNEIKHLHNNAKIVQGEKYLKFDKSTLFITKSNKDIQVLNKIEKLYGLDGEFVAPMSETTVIKKEKIEFYKSKYKSIILYLDGDEAGIRNSISQSEIYDVPYIVNPSNVEKDISDFVKENGLESGFDLINHLIYE